MLKLDWRELSDRAAQLKGPDRGLDAEIWAAIQGVTITEFGQRGSGELISFAGELKYPNWVHPPALSGSFDMALLALDHCFKDAFFVYARGKLRDSEPLYAFDIRFGSDEVVAEAETDWGPGAVLSAVCKAMASFAAGRLKPFAGAHA